MKFVVDFKQLRDFCMFFRNTPKIEIIFKLVLIFGFGGLFSGATFVLFSLGCAL